MMSTKDIARWQLSLTWITFDSYQKVHVVKFRLEFVSWGFLMKKEFLNDKEVKISLKISSIMEELPEYVLPYASYLDEKGYVFTTQLRKIKNLDLFFERLSGRIFEYWDPENKRRVEKDHFINLSEEESFKVYDRYRKWETLSLSKVQTRETDLKEFLQWMVGEGIIDNKHYFFKFIDPYDYLHK